MFILHARLKLHINQKRIQYTTENVEHLMQLHNLPPFVVLLVLSATNMCQHSTLLLVHSPMYQLSSSSFGISCVLVGIDLLRMQCKEMTVTRHGNIHLHAAQMGLDSTCEGHHRILLIDASGVGWRRQAAVCTHEWHGRWRSTTTDRR